MLAPARSSRSPPPRSEPRRAARPSVSRPWRASPAEVERIADLARLELARRGGAHGRRAGGDPRLRRVARSARHHRRRADRPRDSDRDAPARRRRGARRSTPNARSPTRPSAPAPRSWCPRCWTRTSASARRSLRDRARAARRPRCRARLVGGAGRRRRSRAPRPPRDSAPSRICSPSAPAPRRARPTRAARAASVRSPLDGIPVAIKDLMVQEGEPCTCASRILEGFVAPYQGTAVAKLQAAGRGDRRPHQHGRVRDGLVERTLDLRRRAQSVGSRAHARRFVGRLGGGRRGRHRADRVRQRHGRLDPAAGVALRRRRA